MSRKARRTSKLFVQIEPLFADRSREGARLAGFRTHSEYIRMLILRDLIARGVLSEGGVQNVLFGATPESAITVPMTDNDDDTIETDTVEGVEVTTYD